MGETLNDLGGTKKLKAIGSKCLVLYREFQESASRIPWKSPSFSRFGEWIISGSADEGEHKIYIWSQTGYLAKILQGPKETLIDVAWHPLRPIVVSLSVTGLVYIWAEIYTGNWSAFAPEVKDIDGCEEYVEREDEFDIMPETEEVKKLESNHDEEVDIITIDNDKTLSDSELSEEELCFLPAIPSPKFPEQSDSFTGDAIKMANSSFSANAEQDRLNCRSKANFC